MFCINCGQELPDNAKFCYKCGTECPVYNAKNALNDKESGINTATLLQRIEIMLSDGDFAGAMSKCDVVLDSEPMNWKAYLFMLLAELKCRNTDDLAKQPIPFDDNQYYIRAVKYCDYDLASELSIYLDEINSRNEAKQLNPKIGDDIYFGTKSGKKMWWKVLRIKDGMALIITKENVCDLPYHDAGGDITWSDCTLRKWLNSDFLDGYFTDLERSRIKSCKLNNENSKYQTNGGEPTTDKVFLLSIHEALTMFANTSDRANDSWWWLRSPGSNLNHAAVVDIGGKVYTGVGDVYTYGNIVDYNNGVRPALWVKIDT